MDMNAVTSFLAVAEHGGYALAGRALDLPKSTLSRKVAMLERDLGVRLFERTSRRFRLTLEGRELQQRARPLLAEWGDIAEQLKSKDAPLSGSLRVSVPVLFGYRLLGRAAAAFAAAHPGVKLDVVVDDRHVDLLREGFDAALRVNPRPDSELAGRLLMKSSLVLVASKTLAEKMGYPDTPAQNRTWPAVVRSNWGDRGIWQIETEIGTVDVRADVKLSLSSPIAIRDAVLAGAGAAYLPKPFASDDLASGRLIKLGKRSGPADEVWILHASGRLPSRRLVAFMDTLAEWIK